MTRRKLLIWTLCLLSLWQAGTSSPLLAGPAYPGLITVKQSDGSEIKVRVHGDEFSNYVTSEEGYTLAADADGDWAFAKLDASGLLVPTSVKAKAVNRLTASERKVLGTSLRKNLRPLRMTDLQMRLKAERTYSLATRAADAGDCLPPLLGGTTWKPVGNKKVLVLLAEYPDLPFTNGSNEAFGNLLNSKSYTKGGATGSVWQYYYDNSNGKFDPEFTVAGPYRLSKNRAYYKDKPKEMVAEVARLADNDLDFSQFAENGVAHDIFVFYSGGAESTGDPNGIWPHRSTLRNLTLDGVTIPGYACSSELEPGSAGNNTLAAIGSFCHEFGHILGWPDLYDTVGGNDTKCDLPGCFSLMAYGTYNNSSRTPPALSILERWMMGWSEPEILETSGEYSLPAITEGKGYLVKTEADGDYFLLECRGAGKNEWDKKEYLDFYGQGSDWGLLVYHVRNETNSWIGNAVNIARGNEHYKIFYSNPNSRNNYLPQYIPAHCFFPGGSNVTSIYSDNESKFLAANGKKTMVEIPSIRLDAAEGSVKLSVTERNGNITDVKSSVFQHDIILSWKDDLSSGWTVEWKAEGEEAKSITGLTSSEVHIPLLKDAQDYAITITGNKNSKTSLTLKTEKSGTGFPRIQLSKANPTSEDKVLMMLVDCGEMGGIQWTVDGAKADGYTNLRKGEHYVQAVLTKTDGTVEYFARYINVIL